MKKSRTFWIQITLWSAAIIAVILVGLYYFAGNEVVNVDSIKLDESVVLD